MSDKDFEDAVRLAVAHIFSRKQQLSTLAPLPTAQAITTARTALAEHVPLSGLGTATSIQYLLDHILPGLVQAQCGPRYFGFVTGGVTPAAQVADMLVSSYDENVQVSLPNESASTAIEAQVLDFVLDLVGLAGKEWPGKTITTGATASNVLGLACGRDWLRKDDWRRDITVIASSPHFSLIKASSLVGLGGSLAFRSVATVDDGPGFDLAALKAAVVEETSAGRGVIVCGALGEVNTGSLDATLPDVASVCRKHGAWLHVDAAFGGFAALLPEYAFVSSAMAAADSLTLDGHKWLNVPYDCGLFYTRHEIALADVFGPPPGAAPAYLSAGCEGNAVPSPLYSGIENSRRFRALPLLASLLSLGKNGYVDLVRRNVDFARRVASWIDQSSEYELLNKMDGDPIIPLNIVLFRGSSSSRFPPSDPASGRQLTQTINGGGVMYVSASSWQGAGAVRIAVSNWQTGSGGEPEWDIVRTALEQASA